MVLAGAFWTSFNSCAGLRLMLPLASISTVPPLRRIVLRKIFGVDGPTIVASFFALILQPLITCFWDSPKKVGIMCVAYRGCRNSVGIGLAWTEASVSGLSNSLASEVNLPRSEERRVGKEGR